MARRRGHVVLVFGVDGVVDRAKLEEVRKLAEAKWRLEKAQQLKAGEMEKVVENRHDDPEANGGSRDVASGRRRRRHSAGWVAGHAGPVGVGSVDESFAAALISGRPFICLDNFRGRLDSQRLEAFLTCPTLFPARIPHRGEVMVDPKRFLLQMSSNGLEATRDLANRASICRIRKRPGFAYRDTLGELQALQPTFLGAVFSLLTAWVAAGKPRTNETRHDFREWCQVVDWIVQHLMGEAPVMDGHPAAQERVSNPALAWLRSVALALEGEHQLGESLTASGLVEICSLHSISIPGLKDEDNDDKAKRHVGSLLWRVFQAAEQVEVDGFSIRRSQQAYRKPSGDNDTMRTYVFDRKAALTLSHPTPPNSTQLHPRGITLYKTGVS